MNNSVSPIEILIVEDSPTQAAQLKYLLEDSGYLATVTVDGKAALRAIHETHPDLIISDVMMPIMDGYELCRTIKSDSALKHIPVMLVTNLSDPTDVIRGIECGADNFIRKPYDSKYLLSRVRYMLMNIELRRSQRMHMGVEISLGGHKHYITAERQQLLDLLVSTYEQAVSVNTDLMERENQLALSNQVLQGLNRISEGLNAVDTEQAVVDKALQHATELPGIKAGWIFLRTPDNCFRLASTRGLPLALIKQDVFCGDCACQRKLLGGELDTTCNIIECERLAALRNDTEGLSCHACVPLWLGKGELMGLMNLAGESNNLFDDNELRILHNVGNQVAVALERAKLHDNLGNLVIERTTKLASEIEERKRIEREQARLAAIIEATPDFVGSADPEGQIVYINRAGMIMLGLPPDQPFQPKHLREMHPNENTKLVLENAIAHAIAHGSWCGDNILLRVDGAETPVSQVLIAHKNTEGVVEFLSTIMRDITDRQYSHNQLMRAAAELEAANAALHDEQAHLAERVLERTTELTLANAELAQAKAAAEQASRAKSAFLATMSHEIRTPMNGVIGMVDVLTQTSLSEHQADLLNTIRVSANSLLVIIDDILDFSKIEAGKLELEQLPVSLFDLVESLCNSLVPAASHKDVDIRLFISPDIPEHVLSDQVRLRQILYNLMGNAIKFSAGIPERRGRVTIRVEPASQDPLRVTFRISDNGIGMTTETISQLFTPFTQAEKSTTRRYGGTGLGLTICKRLVDLMHGHLDVESVLGKGSSFIVTLPFDVPPDQPIRMLPDLTGLHCILIDGPGFNIEDIRAYLQHAGAIVHIAKTTGAVTDLITQLDSTVVIIKKATRRMQLLPLQEHLATGPHARLLLITQGRRRRARIEHENTVTLDGDAMRRLALLRAVAVAAGRVSPEIIHERTEPLIAAEAPPPSIAEARTQGKLILVAEDDDINQKVILQQLSLLGYAAEFATNGIEALHMWQRGQYALLLTDLHMPGMDGYTLAETIRREEDGRSRIPILALTANALRGEGNRARQAGMDEYLTKPILLPALREMLEKWMPSGTIQASSISVAKQTEPHPAVQHAIDIARLKELVGDRSEVITELLSNYLESSKRLADEISSAFEMDDWGQIGAIAHKLKSSSRSIGAQVLGDLCADLENVAKTEERHLLIPLMSRFIEVHNTVLSEIKTLCK